MARQGGWNPLIGIGFTALGVGYLYEAWKHANGATIPAVPLPPNAMNGNRGALGYAAGRGDPLVIKDGVKSIRFYPAGDISQRVGYIAAQIRKDAEDKQVVTEARTLLSGKCPVERGGVDWCIQPKHWKEEIYQLFNAVTNPNSKLGMRYLRDPRNYDAFGSSALLRRLPAGDCDDFVIRLGALLMAVGYPIKCRVVAPAGQPGQWAHIYLVVGDEPGNENPAKWYPIDPTEPQNGAFWEVPDRLISTKRDFPV